MNTHVGEQAQAIARAGKKPVAVVAGPGTGKTYTLVQAAKSVTGQDPHRKILVLTFTRKARQELRERFGASGNIKIATFHGMAQDLIREELADRQVVTNEQRWQVLCGLASEETFKQYDERELGLFVTLQKNQPDQTVAPEGLVSAYDKQLRKLGLMDHDDVLVLAAQKLEEGRGMFVYSDIFVDEFQDTSPIQYKMLRLFDVGQNLFVIGDPRQAIYSFRGAGASMFDRFMDDYPDALEVELARSHRSSQQVLDVVNAMFVDYEPLRTEKTEEGRAHYFSAATVQQEYDFLARIIQGSLGGTDWQNIGFEPPIRLQTEGFADFAVLTRTRLQAVQVHRALQATGLPVRIVGEESPLMHPASRALFFGFLFSLSGDEALLRQLERSTLLWPKARVLARSVEWLSEPKDLLVELVSRLGTLTVSEQTAVDQAQILIEQAIDRIEDTGRLFAELIELPNQNFYDPTADTVNVMTIHASKGLEFRHVFIADAYDGSIPKVRRGYQTDVTEEKRLLYVALSRAKETVVVTWPKKQGSIERKSSRFLSGLLDRQLILIKDPLQARINRREQRKRQQSLF